MFPNSFAAVDLYLMHCEYFADSNYVSDLVNVKPSVDKA
jgi:hypothetical protein